MSAMMLVRMIVVLLDKYDIEQLAHVEKIAIPEDEPDEGARSLLGAAVPGVQGGDKTSHRSAGFVLSAAE
jgi:hypothetical protein